jgi:hypothetical protein
MSMQCTEKRKGTVEKDKKRRKKRKERKERKKGKKEKTRMSRCDDSPKDVRNNEYKELYRDVRDM